MPPNNSSGEENWWDNIRRARVMARLQTDRWVMPSKSEAGLVRAVIEAYEAELAADIEQNSTIDRALEVFWAAHDADREPPAYWNAMRPALRTLLEDR